MICFNKFWLSGIILSIIMVPLTASAKEAGLPQLDISTWPSQIFWLVLIFGFGYLVMARLVTPRIGTILEERRAKLDDDLKKARSATESAQQIRTEYEANLDATRIEASEIAKKAAAEAIKEAEAIDAKIAKKLADKVAKAETKFAESRREAIANLNSVAAEAAILAISQLTNISVTKEHVNKTADRLSKETAKQETK